MQRVTKRNASLKASMAIKENSKAGSRPTKKKNFDSENLSPSSSNGTKRHSSPSGCSPPNPKRKTFADITNAFSQPKLTEKKPTNNTTATNNATATATTKEELFKSLEEIPKRRSNRLKGKREPSNASPKDTSIGEENKCNSSVNTDDTPVTAVQNILKATTLNDDSLRCEECLQEDIPETSLPVWKDIDQAESHDPLFSPEYAIDIYEYMRRREVHFAISPYLDTQPFINANMRAILIDWLVEVQENFELFHETLYLAVKIVDRYLERKEVKKEYLQLVGATAMLVSSKFEELSPPLVDDFIYLCDDAYTHTELLQMECDILCTMDYDINAPVTYRFLRRYARAAEADLQTHTLARFISESSLQEYEFVADKPSLIAASSLYLAIRMKKLGTWTPTLKHYSGYVISDLVPMVHRLNDLISRPPPTVSPANGTTPTITSTVRSKYSHSVFFEVALIPPLDNVNENASQAVSELEALLKQ